MSWLLLYCHFKNILLMKELKAQTMFRPSNIRIIANMLVSNKNDDTLNYISVKISSCLYYMILDKSKLTT